MKKCEEAGGGEEGAHGALISESCAQISIFMSLCVIKIDIPMAAELIELMLQSGLMHMKNLATNAHFRRFCSSNGHDCI